MIDLILFIIMLFMGFVNCISSQPIAGAIFFVAAGVFSLTATMNAK